MAKNNSKTENTNASHILGTTNHADSCTAQYYINDNKITEFHPADSSTFTKDQYRTWINTLETSPMKTSSPVDVYHTTPYDKFVAAEDPSSASGIISDVDASTSFNAFMDLMRAEGKDPSTLEENAFRQQ